jgi:RsiW-degrading membrane proteinase PrsW (M82 family)
MESMALWEKILLGILVVLVLLWFSPGIKVMFKERREASRDEWMSVLIPIALVAAFVALLIVLT